MKWTKPYSRKMLSLPTEPILTERLLLRTMREDDIPSLWLMDSDPDVMKYIPTPILDKQTYLADMKKDFHEAERFKFFLIIADKKTDEAIGWLLFRPTEDGKWVELGYRLLKKQWGKGYVPEAARAIIRIGFNDLGLTEVMLVLIKENKKSQKVAEKLGFTYQGIRKFYNMDLAFYLLKKTLIG